MSEPTSFNHQRGAIRTGAPSFVAMITAKLPTDIEENVIDQLKDDTLSLRNCALTCRAWRPRSRYHLVSSIRVRTRDDFASLCGFFKRHQNLASLVKALTISPSNEEPSPRSLLEVVLVELLRQLPNLHRYKVVHDPQSIDSALPTYSLAFHPRTLEQCKMYLHTEALHLGPLRLLSYEELGRLVIALRLRNLECSGLTFGRQNGSYESSVRFANKACLSHVSFQDMDSGAVSFVLGLSCVLRSISMEIDGTQELPRIDFSALPQVQALRISLANLADEVEGFAEVARLLADNIPPDLRSVTVILPFVQSGYDYSDLDSIPQPCHDLEEILGSAPLERVTFVLFSIPSNRVQAWRQMMEHGYSALHGRGLLRVECAPGRPKGHSYYVTSLQVSTGNRWIASTAADGTIIAWSVDGRGIIHDTKLPDTTLPFALPCGDCFVSSTTFYSGYSSTIWDVKGHSIARRDNELSILPAPATAQPKHDHSMITVSPSRTGPHSTMKLWEIPQAGAAHHEVDDLPLGPGCAKFVLKSQDEVFLAVASTFMQRSQCLLWRRQQHGQYIREDVLVASESRGSMITTGTFCPITFSPYQPTFSLRLRLPDPSPRTYCTCLAIGFTDGTVKMLSLCVKRGRQASYAEEAEYWDVDSPAARRDGNQLECEQKALYRHDGPVTSLTFSPRGTLLMSASEDSTLKVLARSSPPQRAPVTLRGHRDKVHAACFSSDERYIASASEDRTVRVWRVKDWSCLATFEEHTAAVTHVVFCLSGGAVWSAARDGRVCRHAFAPYIREEKSRVQ